jgi:hypothetical protein
MKRDRMRSHAADEFVGTRLIFFGKNGGDDGARTRERRA